MPSDCRGPEFCIDDLCVNSDQGLCGKWRADLDDFGQEYDDETMVDLGGGMVVPLRELTHWDED